MTLLAVLATVVTASMMLSGIPRTLAMRRAGSTLDQPFFPILAMFACTALWCKYGLLIHDTAIISVNGLGLVVSTLNAYVYHSVSGSLQEYAERQFCITAASVASLLAFIVLGVASPDRAVVYLGLMACIGSLVMFGAPLISLKQVLATKNAQVLSMPFSITSLGTSTLWTLYGMSIGDWNIIIPNAIGAFLASIQVFLIVLYEGIGFDKLRTTSTPLPQTMP
ncbi:hypothetical protein GQ42DRAFT_160626 [Ramicandelaber brevisporus]|nr:hypothetical protein GQ42DRAFT_160626 [Ramicandelaber brevisporus]